MMRTKVSVIVVSTGVTAIYAGDARLAIRARRAALPAINRARALSAASARSRVHGLFRELRELDEAAFGAFGIEVGDLAARMTDSRHLIDQRDAFFFELGQRFFDI